MTTTKPEQPKGQERQRRDRGGRPNRQQRVADEFDQVTIDIARVTRVMAGGKRMRFRACVIVGDRKGRVGMAIAKGADVTLAVDKATTKAKKNLIVVPMINETIPHRVDCKYGAAKVMIKPAPRGTGIMAGGAVRSVLEISGISNVVAKILGSGNKINCIKAALGALERLKQVEQKPKKAAKVAAKSKEKTNE